MGPLLLSFNINAQKSEALASVARRFGVCVQPVQKNAQGLTLAELCGGCQNGETLISGPLAYFDDEMIVLVNFDPEIFSHFLDELRKTCSVRLKAVMTETNSRWNACQLHQELIREE